MSMSLPASINEPQKLDGGHEAVHRRATAQGYVIKQLYRLATAAKNGEPWVKVANEIRDEHTKHIDKLLVELENVKAKLKLAEEKIQAAAAKAEEQNEGIKALLTVLEHLTREPKNCKETAVCDPRLSLSELAKPSHSLPSVESQALSNCQSFVPQQQAVLSPNFPFLGQSFFASHTQAQASPPLDFFAPIMARLQEIQNQSAFSVQQILPNNFLQLLQSQLNNQQNGYHWPRPGAMTVGNSPIMSPIQHSPKILSPLPVAPSVFHPTSTLSRHHSSNGHSTVHDKITDVRQRSTASSSRTSRNTRTDLVDHGANFVGMLPETSKHATTEFEDTTTTSKRCRKNFPEKSPRSRSRPATPIAPVCLDIASDEGSRSPSPSYPTEFSGPSKHSQALTPDSITMLPRNTLQLCGSADSVQAENVTSEIGLAKSSESTMSAAAIPHNSNGSGFEEIDLT